MLNSFADIRSLPADKRRRAIVADIMLRGYATWSALLLSISGVRSWPVFGVVIGCAITIDILRHIFAPELRLSPSELSQLVARREHDSQGVARRLHFMNVFIAVFFIIWAVYSTAFAIIVDPHERTLPPAIVTWLEPMQSVAGAISGIEHRLPADLIARGYVNRAIILGHVYSLGFFIYLGFLVIPLFGFGYMTATQSIWRATRYSGKGLKFFDSPSRYLFIWIVMTWVFYFSMSNFETIDWQYKLHSGWHVQNNNVSLFQYSLTMGAAAYWAYVLYGFVVAYRTWVICILVHD